MRKSEEIIESSPSSPSRRPQNVDSPVRTAPPFPSRCLSVQKLLYHDSADMSRVELCVDTVNGALLVCKHVRKEKLFGQDQRNSAHREFTFISTLSHPNIVDFYFKVETEDEYQYILEFLPNADYFTENLEVCSNPLCKNSEGDLLRLKSYCRDILSGLAYLHASGIVHMDIKPANLFLSNETRGPFKRVKISDFGLSRSIDEEGKVFISSHSWSQFAAPEVKKEHWITSAADMFSFGVFVHLLAFGYTPDKLRWTPGAPLPKHRTDWSPYSSTEFEGFLNSCLALDPTQRLSASAALTSAFIGM